MFRRPKVLHELVIPEDATASVHDRRPRMDKLLFTSMWGLRVSGPDTPESSSIEGSKALHMTLRSTRRMIDAAFPVPRWDGCE